MFNNSKYFIYRGFEIVQNPNSFNIYHENDKLLKIIPTKGYKTKILYLDGSNEILINKTSNNKSIKLVETFIDEHLRKEN